MSKAIKIATDIIVFDISPKEWMGKVFVTEKDYYNFGFRDYIAPTLEKGQIEGNLIENLELDIFTNEIWILPTLLDSQKLGERTKDDITGIYTFSAIDKTAEDLKNEALVIEIIEENQKQEQFFELQKTDWYIIRNIETGVEIPAEILEEREAIREKY